jgi:hypothetical protein
MLQFNKSWRFDSPGPASGELVADLLDLIGKIANQGNRWHIVEHFKSYFAGAAGFTSHWSSDAGWAESDLHSHARSAAENEPLFIEAFYDACASASKQWPEVGVPDVSYINRILNQCGSPFAIVPPELISKGSASVVEVPQAQSFELEAREVIEESLRHSEHLLAEGRGRQAVQELLWLMETISTAFQGVETDGGTVQGKYFNKIAGELRRRQKGKTLEQVLDWITTLHGYLSSPTGGGVRHGADLKAGIAMEPTEARLFCNLVRSYIWFLLDEHRRLTKSDST